MDIESRTWTRMVCTHVCSYVCVFVCVRGEGFLGPRSLPVEKHHRTFGGYHRPIFESAESIEPFSQKIPVRVQDILHCTEFQRVHRVFKTHLWLHRPEVKNSSSTLCLDISLHFLRKEAYGSSL